MARVIEFVNAYGNPVVVNCDMVSAIKQSNEDIIIYTNDGHKFVYSVKNTRIVDFMDSPISLEDLVKQTFRELKCEIFMKRY